MVEQSWEETVCMKSSHWALATLLSSLHCYNSCDFCLTLWVAGLLPSQFMVFMLREDPASEAQLLSNIGNIKQENFHSTSSPPN